MAKLKFSGLPLSNEQFSHGADFQVHIHGQRVARAELDVFAHGFLESGGFKRDPVLTWLQRRHPVQASSFVVAVNVKFVAR